MKSFELDGEEFANVVYLGSIGGPKIIDIGMNTLSVATAKRFRKWLDAAIKEVEADQIERKIRYEKRGRKRTVVIG